MQISAWKWRVHSHSNRPQTHVAWSRPLVHNAIISGCTERRSAEATHHRCTDAQKVCRSHSKHKLINASILSCDELQKLAGLVAAHGADMNEVNVFSATTQLHRLLRNRRPPHSHASQLPVLYTSLCHLVVQHAGTFSARHCVALLTAHAWMAHDAQLEPTDRAQTQEQRQQLRAAVVAALCQRMELLLSAGEPVDAHLLTRAVWALARLGHSCLALEEAAAAAMAPHVQLLVPALSSQDAAALTSLLWALGQLHGTPSTTSAPTTSHGVTPPTLPDLDMWPQQDAYDAQSDTGCSMAPESAQLVHAAWGRMASDAGWVGALPPQQLATMAHGLARLAPAQTPPSTDAASSPHCTGQGTGQVTGQGVMPPAEAVVALFAAVQQAAEAAVAMPQPRRTGSNSDIVVHRQQGAAANGLRSSRSSLSEASPPGHAPLAAGAQLASGQMGRSSQACTAPKPQEAQPAEYKNLVLYATVAQAGVPRRRPPHHRHLPADGLLGPQAVSNLAWSVARLSQPFLRPSDTAAMSQPSNTHLATVPQPCGVEDRPSSRVSAAARAAMHALVAAALRPSNTAGGAGAAVGAAPADRQAGSTGAATCPPLLHFSPQEVCNLVSAADHVLSPRPDFEPLGPIMASPADSHMSGGTSVAASDAHTSRKRAQGPVLMHQLLEAVAGWVVTAEARSPGLGCLSPRDVADLLTVFSAAGYKLPSLRHAGSEDHLLNSDSHGALDACDGASLEQPQPIHTLGRGTLGSAEAQSLACTDDAQAVCPAPASPPAHISRALQLLLDRAAPAAAEAAAGAAQKLPAPNPGLLVKLAVSAARVAGGLPLTLLDLWEAAAAAGAARVDAAASDDGAAAVEQRAATQVGAAAGAHGLAIDLVDDLTPSELGLLCWAVAAGSSSRSMASSGSGGGSVSVAARVPTLLAQAEVAAAAQVEALQPRTLCHVLWAMAALRHPCPDLLEAAGPRILALCPTQPPSSVYLASQPQSGRVAGTAAAHAADAAGYTAGEGSDANWRSGIGGSSSSGLGGSSSSSGSSITGGSGSSGAGEMQRPGPRRTRGPVRPPPPTTSIERHTHSSAGSGSVPSLDTVAGRQQQLEPDQLALCLWSVAVQLEVCGVMGVGLGGGLKSTGPLEVLRGAAVPLGVAAGGLSSRGLPLALWAYAAAQVNPGERVLAALAARAVAVASQLSIQGLAMAARALSHFGCRDPKLYCCLADQLVARMSATGPDGRSHQAVALSNMAVALAKARVPHSRLLGAVQRAVRSPSAWGAREAAPLLWALSVLYGGSTAVQDGRPGSTVAVHALVAAVCRDLGAPLEGVADRHVSKKKPKQKTNVDAGCVLLLLMACAGLCIRLPQHVLSAAAAQLARSSSIARLSSHSLCEAVAGLAALQADASDPAVRKLVGAVAAAVEGRVVEVRQELLTLESMTKLAWGLAYYRQYRCSAFRHVAPRVLGSRPDALNAHPTLLRMLLEVKLLVQCEARSGGYWRAVRRQWVKRVEGGGPDSVPSALLARGASRADVAAAAAARSAIELALNTGPLGATLVRAGGDAGGLGRPRWRALPQGDEVCMFVVGEPGVLLMGLDGLLGPAAGTGADACALNVGAQQLGTGATASGAGDEVGPEVARTADVAALAVRPVRVAITLVAAWHESMQCGGAGLADGAAGSVEVQDPNSLRVTCVIGPRKQHGLRSQGGTRAVEHVGSKAARLKAHATPRHTACDPAAVGLLAPAAIRDRVLARQGFVVVRVCVREWARLGLVQQQQLLAQLLREAVIQGG